MTARPGRQFSADDLDLHPRNVLLDCRTAPLTSVSQAQAADLGALEGPNVRAWNESVSSCRGGRDCMKCCWY